MLSPADEIKSKLDIVDIIKQYIPLRPAGLNFVARCPFHNEKTASFNISPTKQVWHCFGCGKGGDLFSFVMEIEKLNFVEALRLLAPKAGVVLKQESGPQASERNRALDLLSAAAGFYHQLLISNPAAASARQYIARRGLTEEVLRSWQIGYAPDSWDDLFNFLRGKQFSEKEIIAAGLAVNRQGGSGAYNRFRGRLMFPIREVNGNIIGFSGRLLPEFEEANKAQGKYVNSPQTLVYDKSRVLFGLDKAKQAIREFNLAIVVEGQMDCVTAHQFGFANVVASSGTALTDAQVKLLKRYTNRVAFVFDMDEAGRNALERDSEQLFAQEMEALAVNLPSGKDPDECIRHSLDEWKRSLKEAIPVMQFYLNQAYKNHDETTSSGRQFLAGRMIPRLANIINAVDLDFWIKKVSQRIDFTESDLREELHKFKQKNKQENKEDSNLVATINIKKDRDELLSEQLVALLIAFPELIGVLGPYFASEQLAGNPTRALYSQLIAYYNKKAAQTEDGISGFGFSDFRTWLEQQGFSAGDIQLLDRLALLVERNFSEVSVDEAHAAVKNIQTGLRRSYLNRRMKTAAKLIGELERSPEGPERAERLEALLKEFNDLAEEVRQLASPQ